MSSFLRASHFQTLFSFRTSSTSNRANLLSSSFPPNNSLIGFCNQKKLSTTNTLDGETTKRKRREPIQYSSPVIGEEEIEAVTSVLRGGRLVMGPNVRKFENMLSSYCGQKYGIAVTSGTSALSLSLSAMGVGRNHVAVVPAYTWVATYNAPAMLGADVYLADVDSASFCLDHQSSAHSLSVAMSQEQNKTKQSAIIPVHLFGNRCYPPPEGLFDVVLGDGCAALGGVSSDRSVCGSWFPVECFSFHPRKLFTTGGEGGMVVCSDDSFAKRLQMIRDHGASRSPEQREQTTAGGEMIPEFPEAGNNFRMTEMQGALGVCQMKKMPEIVEVRHRVAARYDSDLQDLTVPPLLPSHSPTEKDIYLQLPLAEEPGATRVLTMYPVQPRSRLLDRLLAEQKELSIQEREKGKAGQEIARQLVEEVERIRGIRGSMIKELVSQGVIVRPPMICLLDVEHIQRNTLQQTGFDLRNDEVKASLFPGAFVSSRLNFGLPLHPQMMLDDVERVIDRVRRVVRPDLIQRASWAAENCSTDFTLQYPVRREYFGSYFCVESRRRSFQKKEHQILPHEPRFVFSQNSEENSSSSSTTERKEKEKEEEPKKEIEKEQKQSVLFQAVESFRRGERLPSPRELAKNRELLMYLHIPFCTAKCHYCNFAVDVKNTEERHRVYADRLSDVASAWSDFISDPTNNVTLSGIDIGGGTPTLLSEENLEKILKSLSPLLSDQDENFKKTSLSTERDPLFLSMETTPSIASTQYSKMKFLSDSGVRRISIGIQSTNTTLLSGVNRGAQISQEVDAVKNLQKAGFDRVSTDIIFGLPKQSMEDWKNDLSLLVDLQPDGITTYDCLYRGKGRPFQRRAQEDDSIPSMETYGEMYDFGYNFLTQNGYHAAYGSVNFSRREGETGTSSYFENRLLRGKPYVGLGNYASSLIDRYWIFAPYSVEDWLLSFEGQEGEKKKDDLLSFWPIHDGHSLPVEERVAKHVLLSLSYGYLDVGVFEESFPGWTLSDFYEDALFELVEKRGWLRYDSVSNRYCLVDGCFKYMPFIRSLFYPERCLSWFESMLNSGRSPRSMETSANTTTTTTTTPTTTQI